MAFSKASVRDAQVKGRRVLVRVDFNVPLKDGEVVDDTRIRAALPTLELLRERGAALVLASPLGRPGGKVVPELSLAPVSRRLSELLGVPVTQAPKVVGAEVEMAEGCLGPGEIVLLENTRFEPGETKNDPMLAGSLAALAQVYVNDAFGAAHRAHASTEGVAQFLPGYAGLLLEREVNELSKVVEDPARPLCVVLGGAKVSDKVGVIERFLDTADQILIGGAMCFSFFKAQGKEIGDSLFDDVSVEAAREALAKAEASDCELVLPVDLVLGREFSADTERKELDGTDVPEGWMGLDVGPKTGALYAEAVGKAGTVLWNGPMGAFEMEPFAGGTRAVAAPGGGASLELLEGKKLPGVEALIDAKEPVAEEES